MTHLLADTAASTATPTVRPADEGTVDFSTRLHEVALPDGFFAHLGPRFLRAYHETFVASPHGVALVAWLRGRPVGMLVGTTANRRHYAWVVRNRGRRLARVGALALVGRPLVAIRFVRTRARRYARALRRFAGLPSGTPQRRETTGRGARGRQPPQTAVLTHVAVMDEARGRGAGAALVAAFVAEATRAGAVDAQLVTDADAPGTHRFYERCGWSHRTDRTDRDGRRVRVFGRALRRPSGSRSQEGGSRTT